MTLVQGPSCLQGLYVLSGDYDSGSQLYNRIAAALRGGAAMVQYRDKQKDVAKRERHAVKLLDLCQQYQVPLIINDDVQLAKTIGAAGVHLGVDDDALLKARKVLGQQAIIGVSCYNDITRAETAQQQGASYVAFGRFFSSMNKPHAVMASLDVLHQAKKRLDIPVVAIGGITLDNAGLLMDVGVDMLAVIGAVFDQQDVYAAAHAFSCIYKTGKDK